MINTVDKVKAAQDPREAMLEIARALDRIEAKLNEVQSGGAGSWSKSWVEDVAENLEAIEPAGAGENLRKEGDLLVGEQQEAKPEPSITVTDDGQGNVTIDIPPPSKEVAAKRGAFANEALNLQVAWKELPGDAAIHAYAQGGPIWLYYYDRDTMMAYEPSVRGAMIEDAMIDHPREAAEIARDIMKAESDPPSLEGA